MFKNLQKYKHNSGVTIVELIVVIAIVAILSGMMFFDYGKFKSSTSLQNLADDIALSVRKAQMYAVGARGVNNTFNYGYGVHFTKKVNSNLYEGSNKSFIIFVDIKATGDTEANYSINGTPTTCGDPAGTPTATNECLEMLSITGANKITSIIVYEGANSVSLDTSGTVDFMFKRPNTGPLICYRANGSGIPNCDKDKVEIKVANDANLAVTKTVTIYNNGQISVS